MQVVDHDDGVESPLSQGPGIAFEIGLEKFDPVVLIPISDFRNIQIHSSVAPIQAQKIAGVASVAAGQVQDFATGTD
jgi:hypothetical protein